MTVGLAARFLPVLGLVLGLAASVRAQAPEAGRIDEAIGKGIAFLGQVQHPWGEFPIHYIDRTTGASLDPGFDSSVFGTAHILLGLEGVEGVAGLEGMRDRAAAFLLAERQAGDVWRYYASRSSQYELLVPDVDDTAIVSLALLGRGVAPGGQARRIAGNALPSGLVGTWFFPPGWSHRPTYDNVLWDEHLSALEPDVVVTINACAFLAAVGSPVDRPAAAVVDVIGGGGEREFMVFYDSYLAMAHALIRAWRRGVAPFAVLLPRVEARILELRRSDGAFGWPMDTAFALSVLVATNAPDAVVDAAAARLLADQTGDGSWRRQHYFGSRRYPTLGFGSEAVTTGFCIEALHAYRRRGMRPWR